MVSCALFIISFDACFDMDDRAIDMTCATSACVVDYCASCGHSHADEEFQEFLEAFGDAIVDSPSREVDRLEVGIKSICPDARTVDFETH